MEFFVGLIFVVVLGFFAVIITKGIRQHLANNAAPLLTVTAMVRDKRSEVWGGSGENSRTYTNYYVTFEFDDQSRLELEVDNNEYGLMSAEDRGKLSYQGTRFKGFVRDYKS